MQASFSELEYATKKKQTRRDRFLNEIEKDKKTDFLPTKILPVTQLSKLIAR